jgi:hypothetical protein
MDNPEKLETLNTRNEDKQSNKHNTNEQHVLHKNQTKQ